MIYIGSKNRYSKYLLEKFNLKNKPYIEPFCGGCNVIDKVTGIRIANDSNEYLIEMWKALQNGWIPPKFVSEEEYKDIAKNKEKYPKYLVGYVGFVCTHKSKWFGGYSGNYELRQFQNEQRLNLMKQLPKIKDIIFHNKNYDNFPIPNNSVIYCDPPYQNTTKYGGTDEFDYERFWEWCRIKAKEGHNIFISEYNAPDDFVCVWSRNITVTLENKNTKKRTEKLFVHKTQYKSRSLFDF